MATFRADTELEGVEAVASSSGVISRFIEEA
jgi:hypothetical protein